MQNPTFPKLSHEEITTTFFKTFREETKKANKNHLQYKKFHSEPDRFSLFDYLGIDKI